MPHFSVLIFLLNLSIICVCPPPYLPALYFFGTTKMSQSFVFCAH